ncbi:uncharacterized protein LOC114523545 [Dendronephthya gigantea]|uniref:uncharacterized protein LOC114523545 n=1 Tax=Dendronephthya gigantea TaxID=151771 RepID=UPI00106950AD|nr:uncharacterized protein LOC114523545 [Dendronephthya gigantea]
MAFTRLTCLIFSAVCAIITSLVSAQLLLRSARGEMKLKNFSHLHKHRLKVEPIATIDVDRETKCYLSCTRNEGCFSFNVKQISASNFQCELLNTSKYRDDKNLTQDNSFTHFFLQDPCVPNPCRLVACEPDREAVFKCHCPIFMRGKKCDICVPSHNFALGKPTAQSSTWSGGGYAHHAVDGNRNTIMVYNGAAQCVHTLGGNREWWRVDFGETIPVARVAITNRGDCCWDRMRDFEIKVGDSLINNGLVNPKCGDRHSIGIGTTSITCTPIMHGRYLTIQSQISEDLNFCEVEVYCSDIS